MKKNLLSAGLMLSLGFGAHAQQPAGPETMRTHADTVQALHRLFSKHRTGGYLWSGLGVGLGVRIITASAAGSGGDASGAAVAAGAFGGLPVLIGVGKLLRFSSSREAAAVNAYDTGIALPRYVRHRLRTQYFKK